MSINYRTPEEVMAEAESVIRSVFPDANVPTSIRSSDVPVVHGSTSDLGSMLDSWLVEHADGIGCVISISEIDDGRLPATSRVRSLTPELSKGLEFDLVVLIDPDTFGKRHRGSRRPLCRDDPSDPATSHPHELLTSAKTSSSLCLDSRHRSVGSPATKHRYETSGQLRCTSARAEAAAIPEGASFLSVRQRTHVLSSK